MENIKVSNFRKIKNSWQLALAPITFFTGTNNSGKSTIFKSMLLLEDFIKSNNHFQLDFNGGNQRKYKIDSYSNAVNRNNRNNLDLDIKLEYYNNGHNICLIFKPKDIDEGIISKGKLKLIEISEIDKKNKLIIENTAADDYVLKLDLDFLSEPIKDSEKMELEELVLIQTQKNLLELDILELDKVKKESDRIKGHLREINSKKAKDNGKDESGIRLNKVLRELNISFDRAIDFLDSKGVVIEKKISAKIGNDIYELLRKEFMLDSKRKNTSHELNEDNLIDRLKNLNKNIIDLTKSINDAKKRISELNKKLKLDQTLKKDKVVLMPEFSLTDFHNDYLTIESVIRNILPKYLVEEQSLFGKTDESIEIEKAYKFGEKIRNIMRFSVDHLSPHRNTQTRLYINNNMSSDINEVIRDHSINPFSKTSKAGKFLKKWMREFDIGQDFKIKQIEGVATQIELTDNGLKVNLADKGFGAGQIFTILFKIALIIDLKVDDVRKEKKGLRHVGFEEFMHTILIEEPEANLHPALQVRLANLFLYTFKEFGIKFIVETHSEYLLRQSQVLVKEHNEKALDSSDIPFIAYYFEKDDLPYSMEYNQDGKFSNEFGPGFFDVSANLAFDIL